LVDVAAAVSAPARRGDSPGTLPRAASLLEGRSLQRATQEQQAVLEAHAILIER
jgi:hypothetical protein